MSVTESQLANAFGVEVVHVRTWIGEGMPSDIDAAQSWLIENDYAESPDETITTVRELSSQLNVSLPTVAKYRNQTGFPEGPPWSLKEVLAWKDAHDIRVAHRVNHEPSDFKDQLAEVKLELAKLKLQRERGELIDLVEVVDEITRQNALAKQKLKRLPALLDNVLPAETPKEVRRDFRQRVVSICEDIAADIAACFRDNDQLSDQVEQSIEESEVGE